MCKNRVEFHNCQGYELHIGKTNVKIISEWFVMNLISDAIYFVDSSCNVVCTVQKFIRNLNKE